MIHARHRVTGHEMDFEDDEFAAYRANGWEVVDADGVTESGTDPSPLAHRAAVLAEVGEDAGKALEAYETESDADEPDTELLDELERIAAANTDRTTED